MRYSEIKLVESILKEAEARIQHAEDVIFWEGSKGLTRVINSLANLEDGGHSDVTVKWDGSPAIIFGRDEEGNFVLTDKSGFTAKGYDGRSKSADELEKMLLNRKTSKGQDVPDSYAQFAANMKDIYDEYEKATPKDFRGYFKGDLLYFNTPAEQDGAFTFKPNIVQYSVDASSDLGQRVSQSKTGVVIHRYITDDGKERPVTNADVEQLEGTEVLVVPPVTAQKPAQINDSGIKELKAVASRYGAKIDELLNTATLTQEKMKDFPNILYTYTNSKVDTGLDNLGGDFFDWLAQSKVSKTKQQKIVQYVAQHKDAFNALWQAVSKVMSIKDDIINQFDTQDMPVKQSIPGHSETGGEGYVLAHPGGDLKLVPRATFTKANRSVQREGVNNMKMSEVVSEARYGDDPKTKMIADLGRKLMDMSAKMPMGKGVSDDEIAKSNRMSSFGDALTRFNTDFGPKNMKELIKMARVTPEEAKEFIELAQKAKPAEIKGNDVPEPEDEPEDDMNGPDDDEIARQADMRARRK
jgi:polyhydroxyalkanoate synthesis regulator phasin